MISYHKKVKSIDIICKKELIKLDTIHKKNFKNSYFLESSLKKKIKKTYQK